MENQSKELSQIKNSFSAKRKRKCAKVLSCIFAFSIVFLTFFTITWFVGSSKILNYISNLEISAKANENVIVSKNAETGVATINNKTGRELKILQITDIHFACSIFRYNFDKKVVNQIVKCVEKNTPDIIVVTGDAISPIWITSGTRDSYKQLDAFLALFEKIGIPYTYCFGNHDATGTASKKYISDKIEKAEHSFYLGGVDNVQGMGNYVVKVETNGVLSSSFILMDSNQNLDGDYEGISAKQVVWYEQKIKELQAEKADIKNILFIHVPIPEYASFYAESKKGNQNYEIELGSKSEKVCKGKQKHLYEKMAELGATKWVYCGHDHKNNYSVKDKQTGITLSYGMSMDYTAYPTIKFTTKYRGGRMILLSEDGSVESYLVAQDNNYERVV